MKKVVFFLILAALLLLTALPAFAASDWKEIYSDEDYTVYADKASILDLGDTFEVAERWEYKTKTIREKLAKELSEPPKYDITVKQYSKKRAMYQIITITYYNDKGKAYYTTKKDSAWRILSPGMLGELLWENIKKLMAEGK